MNKIFGYLLISPIVIIIVLSFVISICRDPIPNLIAIGFIGMAVYGCYLVFKSDEEKERR
jgi:uncharacterized MnhB-related membrane protein